MIDYYAWYLIQVCQENVNHQNDFFFDYQISESKVNYLLFCISILLTTEHAASWINCQDNKHDLIKEIDTSALLTTTESFFKLTIKNQLLMNWFVTMKTFNINLVILKYKMHTVSSFVISLKIHKTHHITHHEIRMSSDDSVNIELNTSNWQAEVLSFKQHLKLSFIFTTEDLIQNYWKKTMIEHALNAAKLKTHFKNNNNTKNFNDKNIIIILSKEKKLIFNDLQYYINEFILWVQKLITAFSNDSNLSLSLLLILIQKLVNQFNK